MSIPILVTTLGIWGKCELAVRITVRPSSELRVCLHVHPFVSSPSGSYLKEFGSRIVFFASNSAHLILTSFSQIRIRGQMYFRMFLWYLTQYLGPEEMRLMQQKGGWLRDTLEKRKLCLGGTLAKLLRPSLIGWSIPMNSSPLGEEGLPFSVLCLCHMKVFSPKITFLLVL